MSGRNAPRSRRATSGNTIDLIDGSIVKSYPDVEDQNIRDFDRIMQMADSAGRV